MIRAIKNSHLRRRTNELRRKLHPIFPVYVRQVHGLSMRRKNSCLGDAELCQSPQGGHYFLIRLAAEQSWDSMWQALVHEFAHCLSWNQDDHEDLDHHDAAWGVAYAKVYSALGDLE